MESIPGLTGDGKFDGETFLGGLWMFFLGDGGGEEETPGHGLLSRFRRTTQVSEQSCLCYK